MLMLLLHENLLERAEAANPGICIVTPKFRRDQNIEDLHEEIVQKNRNNT